MRRISGSTSLTAGFVVALLCAGFGGCPEEKAPPQTLGTTHEMINAGLARENMRSWDEWILRLTASAENSVDSRIALGQMFLALYRQRGFVASHGFEMASLEDFVSGRHDPSGRALLAEAAWYFSSVVSENVLPADRQTAIAGMIEVLEEKRQSITSPVAAGIPAKPSETKQRFLWLGLTHLEIVFLSSQFGVTESDRDLERLRGLLKDHAELMDAISRDAAPNKTFREYFERRRQEALAMTPLDAKALQQALAVEPWKTAEFTRMSPSVHRKRGADAMTAVIRLRGQDADKTQIYEEMEKALLHDLYLVESTCMVHRDDAAHEESISDSALESARAGLDWILGVAQSTIRRPE